MLSLMYFKTYMIIHFLKQNYPYKIEIMFLENAYFFLKFDTHHLSRKETLTIIS